MSTVYVHELMVTLFNLLEDGNVTRRDTTMTFMTFVNCDIFNAYACRSADRAFYEISPFSNVAFLWAMGFSIMGQFAVIYFPPLQSVFQTEALSLGDLFLIVCLSSMVLLLDTIRKKFLSSYCSDTFRKITFSKNTGKTKKRDGVDRKRQKFLSKSNKAPPSGNGIRARNLMNL